MTPGDPCYCTGGGRSPAAPGCKFCDGTGRFRRGFPADALPDRPAAARPTSWPPELRAWLGLVVADLHRQGCPTPLARHVRRVLRLTEWERLPVPLTSFDPVLGMAGLAWLHEGRQLDLIVDRRGQLRFRRWIFGMALDPGSTPRGLVQAVRLMLRWVLSGMDLDEEGPPTP